MKTHVTVIPSDGIISVDGEVLFLDGIKSETFHALQWHDGAGHVEPGDGLPNEELSTDDYAGRVAPYVALWEEEKARLEEEANRPPTDEELAAQAVAEARAQSRSILMARMQADMVQTGHRVHHLHQSRTVHGLGRRPDIRQGLPPGPQGHRL